MDDPGYPALTLSFDLLFRGWEITTGGQRLHRYGAYVEKMQRRGLDPDQFGFYLETFRFERPPHGRLERITAGLLGLANIREATPFPRHRDRLPP